MDYPGRTGFPAQFLAASRHRCPDQPLPDDRTGREQLDYFHHLAGPRPDRLLLLWLPQKQTGPARIGRTVNSFRNKTTGL